MIAESLGTLGRIWSATARHWPLAACGVSWAKAVAMNAETTRRPLLPACASTLRMKWTRQRCQVALSTLLAAVLMPSWASETTSLTPCRPRRVSLRRNSVQIGWDCQELCARGHDDEKERIITWLLRRNLWTSSWRAGIRMRC